MYGTCPRPEEMGGLQLNEREKQKHLLLGKEEIPNGNLLELSCQTDEGKQICKNPGEG